MIIPIHFHNLLNIILGVHLFIVCFILYGVYVDGKKNNVVKNSDQFVEYSNILENTTEEQRNADQNTLIALQNSAAQSLGFNNYQEFVDIVTSSAPSDGHCNVMGTASTMNSLAEALGMSLTGIF